MFLDTEVLPLVALLWGVLLLFPALDIDIDVACDTNPPGYVPIHNCQEPVTAAAIYSFIYSYSHRHMRHRDIGDNMDTEDNIDTGDSRDTGDNIDTGDNMDNGDNIDTGYNMDTGDNIDSGDSRDIGDNIDTGDNMDLETT